MKDLNTYLNESIFDDEDVQMDKLDGVTEFGNFYTLWWYEVSKDHDFSYFFKKSDIKKLAAKQGYFNRDWFGISLKNIRGTMMTNTKNQYMIPLCNLLGHLQFDMNIEVFKKTVEDFVKANERGPVQVSVDEGNINLDKQITITLRRVTDEGIKRILMRFKKKK